MKKIVGQIIDFFKNNNEYLNSYLFSLVFELGFFYWISVQYTLVGTIFFSVGFVASAFFYAFISINYRECNKPLLIINVVTLLLSALIVGIVFAALHNFVIESSLVAFAILFALQMTVFLTFGFIRLRK